MTKKLLINFIISSLALIFTFYLTELIISLNITQKSNYQKKNEYDSRTGYEVFKDLNSSGIESYPWIGPILITSENDIVPLGGISDTTVIMCNELGYWSIYESDKYGFNNKNESYDKKIDLLLLGDSMTEGACVKYEDSFSANFIKKNINTISLAKGGNDFLINFATLKEYYSVINSDVVLWMHYVNDIADLHVNFTVPKRSNTLMNYLNDNLFKQDLVYKQNEINDIYKKEIDKAEDLILVRKFAEETPFRYSATRRFLTLYNLRTILKKIYTKIRPEKSRLYELNSDFEIFEKAMIEYKKFSLEKNFEPYFVWIPWQAKYLRGYDHYTKVRTLEIVKKHNINIIDLHVDLLEKFENGMDFYSHPQKIHLNEKGFNIITDFLYKRVFSK